MSLLLCTWLSFLRKGWTVFTKLKKNHQKHKYLTILKQHLTCKISKQRYKELKTGFYNVKSWTALTVAIVMCAACMCLGAQFPIFYSLIKFHSCLLLWFISFKSALTTVNGLVIWDTTQRGAPDIANRKGNFLETRISRAGYMLITG